VLKVRGPESDVKRSSCAARHSELAHGGFHVFGANSIERNLKFNFEK